MKAYETIEVVGDGAFGTVLKCRNKETGQLVAIKKMKQRYSSWEECCQLKEVTSLRKIKHQNVVRLLEVFREDEHLFLVFELLHGSLYKSIRDHDGPFSEAQVRFCMKQILLGLQYIHRCGFFHRDMKPENVLWDGDTMKICDFGLAREIRSKPPYTEYVSTRWYRAPEIVLRHQFYNSPVDIWAAGCIMAELFTSKPLFQGTSETDQLFKICSVLGTPGPGNWPDGVKLAQRLNIRLPSFTPTPLHTIIPNASPEAIDLLNEMLTYDPAKRPSATKALQHPWFNGPVEAVRKTAPKVPPKVITTVEKIDDNRKMKDDESIKVDVQDISKKAPQIPPRRIEQDDEELKDPSFDDIFENL